jgi:hypothetical protein
MLISTNAYRRRTNAYWYNMGGVVKREYGKREKRERRIGQVDLETGELLKGFVTWIEGEWSKIPPSSLHFGMHHMAREALLT